MAAAMVVEEGGVTGERWLVGRTTASEITSSWADGGQRWTLCSEATTAFMGAALITSGLRRGGWQEAQRQRRDTADRRQRVDMQWVRRWVGELESEEISDGGGGWPRMLRQSLERLGQRTSSFAMAPRKNAKRDK